MVLDRKSLRVARPGRRPHLEFLEARTLLTGNPQVADISASIPSPSPAADGSTGGLADFDRIVGGSATRSRFGVDGAGLSVAVIDTGVNYRHDAFGGGLGAGGRVVGGYDFAEEDSDPFAETWQHGTAVAGLIASGDPAHPGVAPGAGIVALRVFGDDNQGDFNRIADAFQWVIDHHEEFQISAVNLSISDGNNYTRNFYAADNGIGQRMATLIGRLRALGIPVVTATGNSFAGEQGVGYTAIDSQTISVTSSDATDRIVANAQRLGSEKGGEAATDLAAPGVGLTAPAEGDSYTTVEGTSFSTPLVTGAVVLLQQLYRSRYGRLPTVSDLEGWLKAGADTITDSLTGISLGRLNVEKAAGLVPVPQPQLIAQDPPPSIVPVEEAPGTDPVEDVPATAIGQEPPVAPQQQTELFVNGQTVGTFGGDDLTATLKTLFPESVIALTDLRVWDRQPGAPDGHSSIDLDQLLVWDNSAGAEQRAPGQSQAAGKVGKARDLVHPRVHAWRELAARRRRLATFVRKDSQG